MHLVAEIIFIFLIVYLTGSSSCLSAFFKFDILIEKVIFLQSDWGRNDRE